MSASDHPADAGAAPEPPDHASAGGRLTATDVRTYATLAWAAVPLVALVNHPLMWIAPAGLLLHLRGRDPAGLLRLHLGQAVSFSAVMTIYAVALRHILDAAGVHGRGMTLYPVFVALAVSLPCLRAIQAARRLRPYHAPQPLAWIPVERD